MSDEVEVKSKQIALTDAYGHEVIGVVTLTRDGEKYHGEFDIHEKYASGFFDLWEIVEVSFYMRPGFPIPSVSTEETKKDDIDRG